MPTGTAPQLTEHDARLIADARAMAAATSNAKRRDYLRSTGSGYADHLDDGVADGAFLGAVEYALEALARRLEHELTRNA